MDFNELRNYIVKNLENEQPGHRFPEFILHSDSDGEWEASVCADLHAELREIIDLMKARPAVHFTSEWQNKVAKSIGLVSKNAFESFVDVDGEFVLERICGLATLAIERQRPIIFQ